MSVPVYPVRIIQKLLKMTKVRYLNRGGSPKDANNDIELDGMKIDRNLFSEKFRDSNDMSSWMDGYKHMDGPKLRRSVFKRVSEMANAVLSGNMTLEDLNKFKSSNKNFASDGDTKRRFLGGYDSRDENTVNAISAAYLMDVMKRSKSAEKKDEPSDLPKYESSFGDFMASIGINPEAASSVLSKYDNRSDRLKVLSGWMSKWRDKMSSDKESGKYNADSDWSNIDRISSILGMIGSEDDYNKNRVVIDQTDPYFGSIISDALGYSSVDKNANGSQKDEYALAQEENKKLQRESDTRKLQQANELIKAKRDIYDNLSSDISDGNIYSPFVEGINIDLSSYLTPEYRKELAEIYGKRSTDDYKSILNKIEDGIAKLYNEYTSSQSNKGTTSDNRRNFWMSEYTASDPVFATSAANTRYGRIRQYLNAMQNLGIGNRYIYNTYNPSDNSVAVFYNNGLRRMNLRQAVNAGLMSNEDALRLFNNGYMRSVGYMEKGGVLIGQDGLELPEYTLPERALWSESNGPSQSLINLYNQYEADKNNRKAEKQLSEANKKDVKKRVKEVHGSLNTKHAKEAAKTGEGFGFDDYARVASGIVNLSSAITGLTGLSPVSAGLGVVGTLANAVADYSDDSMTGWQATKNMLINLGFDAASLVPFAGSAAAGAKVARVAKSLIYPISAIVNAKMLGDGEGERVLSLMKKASTNYESMSNQDWTDLLNGANRILGIISMGANARSKMKTFKNAAKPGRVAINVFDKNGKPAKLSVSENEWNYIQKSGIGKNEYDAIESQNNAIRELFGDNFTIRTRLRANRFMPDANKNEVYDVSNIDKITTGPIRFTSIGRLVNPIGTNPRYQTGSMFRFGNVPIIEGKPAVDVGTVHRELDNGIVKSIKSTTQKAKDSVNDASGKVMDRFRGRKKTEDNQKPNTDSKPKNSSRTSGPKRKPSSNNATTHINPDSMKKGGVVRYMQSGGENVRNTYSQPVPLRYGDYVNLWGKTVGGSLVGTLSGLKPQERTGFIDKTRSIQSTYKGAVDASGVGYNQSNVRRFGEVGTHQRNFNERYNEGNKAIEDASKKGLITRPGNTGDNQAGGWVDNLHGVQDSLRTFGAAFSDADKETFENSDAYQNVRSVAAMKGMTYLPIKDLSSDGKTYYGFGLMPELNPNGISPALATRSTAPVNQPLSFNPQVGIQTAVTQNDDRSVSTTPGTFYKDVDGDGSAGNPMGAFLMSLADPITSTVLNLRNTRRVVDANKPALITPYRIQKAVENDYFAKRNAEESAARLASIGDRMARGTSNQSLGYGAWLNAVTSGEDVMREGYGKSAERFYKTRDLADAAENQNKYVASSAANANMAEMVSKKFMNEKALADASLHNWTGVWQPWMRERRAMAYKNAIARQQLEQNINSAQMTSNLKSFLAKNAGGSDYETIMEWLSNPENKKLYDEEKARLMREMPAYKPVESYMRASDYLPIFAKRGGTVTKKTVRVSNGMDTFTKEFFKNERAVMQDRTKRIIASGVGSLIVAKMNKQTASDFNRTVKANRNVSKKK